MGIISRWLVRIVLPLALLLVAGAAMAEELTFPVVTGKEWKHSSKDEKLSFINGVTTIIELEKEIQGRTPGSSGSSLVDGWVRGLSGMRLQEIAHRLDDYYRNNPAQDARPVIEVMWTEIAAPNLPK